MDSIWENCFKNATIESDAIFFFRQLSQDLYGFDSQDFSESEQALANLGADTFDNDSDDTSKADNSKSSEPTTAQCDDVENASASEDKTTEIVTDLDDGKATFAEDAPVENADSIAEDNVTGKHFA